MKLKSELKIGIVAVVCILVIPLFISIFIFNEESASSNKTDIESVIVFDKEEELVYSDITDKFNLPDDARSIEQNAEIVDKAEQAIIQKRSDQEKELKRLAKIKTEEAKIEQEKKRIEAQKELERLAAIEKAEVERKLKEQEEAKRLLEEQKRNQPKQNTTPQKKKEEKVELASRGSGHQSNYEVTFYTAFCDTGCTGVTASGFNVSNTIYYQGYRIVAAPPNIPLHTKLRITFSDGSTMDAIALDRGGAIKGKILDILVSSREEAIAKGRQQVKVEILH